jgi:hypothetical protein
MSRHGRIAAWVSALLLAASSVSLGVFAGDEPDDETGDTVPDDDIREATPSGPDAGVAETDAGVAVVDQSVSSREAAPFVKDSEVPPQIARPPKSDRRSWRHDPSSRRRPGSYLGGSLGYAMAFSWFTYEQRDFRRRYEIGPVHGLAGAIRAGDAFFDWLAVGFQVNITAGTFGDVNKQKTAGFGLYLDTTLYPAMGFGIRPSVGLGFAYSQAGKESYKFAFGGPLSLSVSLTYEGRISRWWTLGPVVQLSWITGDQYDVMYITFGLELLKWFRTAEG